MQFHRQDARKREMKPQVKDGWIEVSNAPGFGIELDAEMVRRYRVTK